jgi:RND family efflux transporter MFP subunit
MHYLAINQRQIIRAVGLGVALLFLVLMFAATANAQQGGPRAPMGVEGFTSPYRVLQIGAPEPGIVEELLVREGDAVRKGDVLARLDTDVHLMLLAIAKKSMELEGKLMASRAELSLRERRLATIDRLHSEGHARREEYERAVADRDIAAGNVLSAEEQLLLKKLEHDKIVAQIERRNVRAPLDGFVTSLLKQVGEFAAPNDPELLVLVQLDPLLAEFAVAWSQAKQLKVGDEVTVLFDESNQRVRGKVEFVSPLTDAESGTVTVKVRLANPDGRLRSGDHCTLQLSGK